MLITGLILEFTDFGFWNFGPRILELDHRFFKIDAGYRILFLDCDSWFWGRLSGTTMTLQSFFLSL